MKKYSDRLANDSVTIFLLHGVINKQVHQVRNYTKKHITNDVFYNFLKDLNSNGQALSMDDVVHHVTYSKKFPKNSFVITFDDGFENNYSIAYPLLKQFNIPATFYITTQFIESNLMSWIDRIEYAVELSKSGQVTVQSNTWDFNNDIESKKALLNNLRRVLKNNKEIDLNSVATDIQSQLGFETVWSSDDPLDKKMSWSQVSQLQSDPLCIVGGHTHTHPVLSNLTDEASENEITKSLEMIRTKIGLQCTHYSYPEGLSNCYSDREISLLKNKGIICCPSAEDGLNTVSSDLFHLKRVFVI